MTDRTLRSMSCRSIRRRRIGRSTNLCSTDRRGARASEAAGVTQQTPPLPGQKMTVPQAFATAAALHRQGRLSEAERVYRAILQIDGKHVDALHSLGVVCTQRGRPAEAEP